MDVSIHLTFSVCSFFVFLEIQMNKKKLIIQNVPVQYINSLKDINLEKQHESGHKS